MMGRTVGSTLNLTIESKMNNKKVIHNGMMGVYNDFTPVLLSEVNGLSQWIKDLHTYLVTRTNHTILLHTFGVEIQVGDKQGDMGKAFVGYDESLDSKLRLCYCNDTFLAMELMGLLKTFKGGVTGTDSNLMTQKVSSLEVKEEETSSESVESKPQLPDTSQSEININEDSYRDFGWGASGEHEVLAGIKKRIEKVEDRLAFGETVSERKIKTFSKQMSNLLKANEVLLTKGMDFKQGEPAYILVSRMLNILAEVDSYLVVNQYPSHITLETLGGKVLLNIYDKTSNIPKVGDVGNVAFTGTVPMYKGVRKVLAVIGSSVSFNRLREGEDEGKGVTTTTNPKKKPDEEKQSTPNDLESGKQEVGKQEDKEYAYFDIYLTHSGSWGKTGGKYDLLKQMIEGIIVANDIDGVSLRGLDDTEVLVDWVIEKETYTMAITKTATKVNELEVKYDMAIAYDTDYPEILEALIVNKLKKYLTN